jgi:tetratricopeptide (TPR) repeat protein
LYEKAANLAFVLSTQYGRCSALESICKITYYTKNTENDLWAVLSRRIFDEIECKDGILAALSNVVHIKDDPELVNRILTHDRTEAYSGARALEHLADQAMESEDNGLLNKALTKLEQYSNVDDERHHFYIESLARVLMRRGNFEKALAVSEKITYIESRASIQVQIAASMLRVGLELEARQAFAEAEKIASSVQTYSQWQYGLAKWSASLFQLGYRLEAIAVYQPDQVFDYTEIVDDWETELDGINLNFRRDMFLEIIRIHSWTDVEWATVIDYLQETSYAQIYK